MMWHTQSETSIISSDKGNLVSASPSIGFEAKYVNWKLLQQTIILGPYLKRKNFSGVQWTSFF